MVAADPYHRELSIHNGQYYNHSRPWISHISMQCHDASCVDLAKNNWTAKPIVSQSVVCCPINVAPSSVGKH